ncbi:hypothetical protein ACFQ2M_40145 [Kitasatospora saccharophila]|uniref:hypothetical protein n=1 Tax=Kitasatospora saccharophila TaxID=407973 RepID=UPI0036322FC8
MTERLAGLGGQARTVTEAVAVLDEPVSEELIAEVAALSAEQVSAGLVEALRAAVLDEPAPARYAFRRETARQVAYRRIPGPTRSALHRRAVEALRAREPQPLARIAAHTRALGDRNAWPQAAEAAAEQAVEQGDTAAAGSLLRELLAEADLTPSAGDGPPGRSPDSPRTPPTTPPAPRCWPTSSPTPGCRSPTAARSG